MRQGEYSFGRDGNKLILRYQNKQKIYLLSSIHQAKSAASGKRNRDGTNVSKPASANDFNKYMGIVDRKMQCSANTHQ